MTITKVKYEKLFPTGAYANEKIGFEAEIGSVTLFNEELLEAGIRPVRIETPEEVISNLRSLAESIHKQAYPHLYTESGKLITYEQVTDVQVGRTREDEIKAHLQTINECKTLRNLEMFAQMVQRENVDVLYEAYHNKKKELQ